MNSQLRISLEGTADQAQRLVALQTAFADVCNALAPIVRDQRCWNRVTLHHLAYRQMRQSFPLVGSQMVCNAIYAVCRAARSLFQDPGSPVHMSRFQERPLPLMHFEPSCPVYFDRHTLSLKDGQVSLYTLDGRMRFQLQVDAGAEKRFTEQRLRELYLARTPAGSFELVFSFGEHDAEDAERPVLPLSSARGEIPLYLTIEERA